MSNQPTPLRQCVDNIWMHDERVRKLEDQFIAAIGQSRPPQEVAELLPSDPEQLVETARNSFRLMLYLIAVRAMNLHEQYEDLLSVSVIPEMGAIVNDDADLLETFWSIQDIEKRPPRRRPGQT